MKQPLFVTHCIWFCILQLKFFYFTGILNIYLNRNLDANKEKGKYYGIVMDILQQIMIRENIVVYIAVTVHLN